MTPFPPRPSVDFIIAQANGRPSEIYARFLLQLLQALAERDEQIETLRAALNEVRADPTSVFPDIPAF